ncbi:hypothetical protein D3C71_1610590 [compost metagenome]
MSRIFNTLIDKGLVGIHHCLHKSMGQLATTWLRSAIHDNKQPPDAIENRASAIMVGFSGQPFYRSDFVSHASRLRSFIR